MYFSCLSAEYYNPENELGQQYDMTNEATQCVMGGTDQRGGSGDTHNLVISGRLPKLSQSPFGGARRPRPFSDPKAAIRWSRRVLSNAFCLSAAQPSSSTVTYTPHRVIIGSVCKNSSQESPPCLYLDKDQDTF